MRKILIDEATVKLVLEYLEESDNYLGSLDHSKPIAALREALEEQPAQQEYTSFAEWANDYVRANLHKLKPAQQEPIGNLISGLSDYLEGERYEQPAQQEPVAHFGSAYINENGVHVTTVLGPVAIPQDAKLYTAPQPAQRTWVGLTEKRIKEIWLNGKDHGDDWRDVLALARSFEAELKGLNT